MQKQRRLQRFGQHIEPEDGPVQRVELAGVLERVQGEGDQAEEVEVGGARGRPAAEENIDADGQVDQADEAQSLLQAAVQRLGNHLDRRIQGNAVAGDDVVDLAVAAGAVECAFQIVGPRDRCHGRAGGIADSGQQVSRLDAGALAGHVRQNSFCFQPASGLAPPHAVVRLLELALLQEIENSQNEQGCRGQGQQRSLRAIEKACLHGRGLF